MITNIHVIFVVHSLIQLNCNGCVCEYCSKFISVSAVNGKISFLKTELQNWEWFVKPSLKIKLKEKENNSLKFYTMQSEGKSPRTGSFGNYKCKIIPMVEFYISLKRMHLEWSLPNACFYSEPQGDSWNEAYKYIE